MSEIQEIKDRLALSQVVGEVVKLTKAGAYWRGLCPFHHEKSPSFFVNDDLGYYKCFGCGEYGDIFTFRQKYEHLTFREALEDLAKQAGVKLTSRSYDPQEKLLKRALEVLAAAANFYHHNLYHGEEFASYRDYLKKRHLSNATGKLFMLGAAGEGWQTLIEFLQKEQFSREEILASGLVGQSKTGRLFSRFRSRLMFPLKNHRGQVVGFSGRLIADKPQEAKYINTPETICYHKSKMLYGLAELAPEIKKAGFLLVVEGEFDVLSSLEAKVPQVVAIKGSAFTSYQAKLISRYVKRVVLALDADAAGMKATKKAVELLRPEGVEIEVLPLPAGKDPDDLASSDPAAWRALTKATISVYEYFLQVILQAHDVSKISEQKKVVQQAAEFFSLIDNHLEYEYYLQKLAHALKQDKEIIRQDLQNWAHLVTTTAPAATTHLATKPARVLTKLQRLEAYLWFLFLHCLHEQILWQTVHAYMQTATFANQFLQQLQRAYLDYSKNNPHPSLAAWQKTLPVDFQEKIALLLLNPHFVKIFAKANLAAEWQVQSSQHQLLSERQKVSLLSKQLKELESIDDPTIEQEAKKTALLQQILDLKKHAKNS